jgi:catechol 2,3-dioxygenase-like lactoylglutathione lyase family enzyme
VIVGVDHVQLAMPVGQEDQARQFYGALLGLPEVTKPSHLASRGGVWFERANLKIHLGVDPNFTPAKKAHPGLLVTKLGELTEALRRGGYEVETADALEGYIHCYVDDPFGNRLELLERT